MLVLAGCHRTPGADTGALTAEGAPVAVKTVVARQQDVARYLRVTGELRANVDSTVAADAVGKVLEAPVERGATVRAGDVLAKLDTRSAELALREAEAAVKQAQSALDLARAELERNTPLAAMKAVADTDLQRLRAQVKGGEANVAAAEARRDTARKAVDDAVIRAPFDGQIVERLVEPGTYVRPDSPVARLVDIRRLRLVIDVPEPVVPLLRDGQRATFTVAAHPGQTFTATVTRRSPALRQGSRDVLVEADVDNSDQRLLPGMFAEGRLVLPSQPGVVVPVAAVHTKGPLQSLFVVDDGHVVERLVEPGEPDDGWLEIPSGVKEGEPVVVDPPPDLTDGAPVLPSL